MESIERTKSPVSLKSLWKRFMLYGFASVMRALRPIVTEDLQCNDIYGTLQDKELVAGPVLWTFKHETTFDPVNVMSLWSMMNPRPDIKIVAKRFEGKERLVNIFSPLFFNFYRSSHRKAGTEEEHRMMREENLKNIRMMKDRYLRGGHNVIFPEGTTNTDGTIFPVKPGCYWLSFFEQEGSIFKVPIVPVGLTYDFLASRRHWLTKRRRNLAFINVGRPFRYKKVSDDLKEDISHHLERVRSRLIELNTLTTTHLAGEYILAKALRDVGEIGESKLQRIVEIRVKELRGLEGVVMDKQLLDENSRVERVATLYDNLSDYRVEDGRFDVDKVKREVVDDAQEGRYNHKRFAQYKKNNPLRYCVNRLIQMSERKTSIDEILNRTRNI